MSARRSNNALGSGKIFEGTRVPGSGRLVSRLCTREEKDQDGEKEWMSHPAVGVEGVWIKRRTWGMKFTEEGGAERTEEERVRV